MAMASALLVPQNASSAWKPPHTAGRSGEPNRSQRLVLSRWAQRTPEGLPWGMRGSGDEIDGAMQQAPQPGRHSMGETDRKSVV